MGVEHGVFWFDALGSGPLASIGADADISSHHHRSLGLSSSRTQLGHNPKRLLLIFPPIALPSEHTEFPKTAPQDGQPGLSESVA